MYVPIGAEHILRRKAAKAMPMPHGEAHPQAIVHENFCWATDSVTFPIDNSIALEVIRT